MLSIDSLAAVLQGQWQQVRQLTYDYLELLEPDHLELRLPFPEAQSIGYQFWCMLGAQESYTRKLEHGKWLGFRCSLPGRESWTPELIGAHMREADVELVRVLAKIDILSPLLNGQPGYEVIFQLLKHEMHHHGQLINLMYCHHLPIPPSWADEWSLKYANES